MPQEQRPAAATCAVDAAGLHAVPLQSATLVQPSAQVPIVAPSSGAACGMPTFHVAHSPMPTSASASPRVELPSKQARAQRPTSLPSAVAPAVPSILEKAPANHEGEDTQRLDARSLHASPGVATAPLPAQPLAPPSQPSQPYAASPQTASVECSPQSSSDLDGAGSNLDLLAKLSMQSPVQVPSPLNATGKRYRDDVVAGLASGNSRNDSSMATPITGQTYTASPGAERAL